MTASISIATPKPRTQRTAKGLILSGAAGKKARRDGRHPQHYRQTESMTRKATLDITGGIVLNSFDDDFGVSHEAAPSANDQRSNRAVFTTESPGFAVKPPTHRRRVRNVRRSQAVSPPECDSDDDHIVVVSDCDAWRLRCAR